MNKATEKEQQRTELDNNVMAVYSEIFALPQEQIGPALAVYWAGLQATCSKENPCAECVREMAWMDAGGL